MKNIVFGTIIAVGLSTPAFAEAFVQDQYKTVTKRIPHTENVCKIVDVPVYGSHYNNNNTGDILTGAIIGGIIGNNIKGEKNGGAAGAVIGGLIGNAHGKNTSQTVIGYRQEQRCNNVTSYTTQTQEVYSHSVVTFTHEGRTYRVNFRK